MRTRETEKLKRLARMGDRHAFARLERLCSRHLEPWGAAGSVRGELYEAAISCVEALRTAACLVLGPAVEGGALTRELDELLDHAYAAQGAAMEHTWLALSRSEARPLVVLQELSDVAISQIADLRGATLDHPVTRAVVRALAARADETVSALKRALGLADVDELEVLEGLCSGPGGGLGASVLNIDPTSGAVPATVWLSYAEWRAEEWWGGEWSSDLVEATCSTWLEWSQRCVGLEVRALGHTRQFDSGEVRKAWGWALSVAYPGIAGFISKSLRASVADTLIQFAPGPTIVDAVADKLTGRL